MIDLEAPLPENLGECIDEYKDLNELRLAMQKEVDAVKKRESALQEHLLQNISKQNKKGEFGTHYKAQVKQKQTIRVADWDKFFPFIKENDRFDMLQKSIAQKAVKDFFEETEKLPPGTEKMQVPWLSITKIN